MRRGGKLRCFVTGAAGFIGSHLAERLLAQGHLVTGYDNLSSGREENLRTARRYPGFAFVRGDVLDLVALRKAMEGHDAIFHLAANGDIRAGITNPRIDLELGVIATFNVLEAMRFSGARSIVFTSSGTVYGMASVVPTPETVGPLLPMSFYAASKLAGEGMVSAAAYTSGFSAWILRLGNVVGDRMNRGVIFDFIRKLRSNPTELEILGDGNQQKTYILVEDCVEGILFAYENVNTATCNMLHLSSAQTLRVREVASIVVEEMGLRNVKFRYTGGQGGWVGDQPVAIFDTSKAQSHGWSPTRRSDEAVRIATRSLLRSAKE